ncbi:lysylphosphatidylglycerol synthase domain-containing protein [Halostreptopolyspora alba]|uniref:TIGR00374 family protein n=1 Tax=Halostreptopolyspora alba TaxID=2487137 RepID=A0A3N0E1W2_9ACTN|nr:TIGR00374 family protein [Nocardiopsaceae bacterium YIM 96095]
MVTDTDAAETTDPNELRALVPPSLLALLVAVANLTVIILVSITALEALIRREFRQVVRGLVAGALGYGLAGAINAAVFATSAPAAPPDVLVGTGTESIFTTPLHGYLAAAIGYVRAMPLGHLPRIRGVMWSGIAVTAASVLLAGVTTSLALLLTLLVGWMCASVARYAVGMSAPVPATDRLVRELRRFDLEPLNLMSRDSDANGNQRFVADTVDRRLDIVLMRADDTAGIWKRLLGVLLLRTPVAPPLQVGLHRRVEHAALMHFAAREAGAAVPGILAITELGAGTIALVREHVPVRRLNDLSDQEVTSDLLERAWAALLLLHRNRIAHGNLSGATVGVRLDGRVIFTDLAAGSVAASPLRTSLDLAALLTTLAMRVGEERAVHTAVRALGVEPVAGALSLLQPAGMPQELRTELRSRPGLLGAIRGRITAIAPEAPARPAKLERMQPRTVVSVVVATVVGIVLVYQLVDVNLATIQQADLGWAAASLGASLLCMLAAAMALMGFVPIRLPFWPTVLAQYAVAFVRIAAPAGVSMIALNTRYVSRMGASGGLALSAVGLSQAVGLLMHVPMMLVFAYLTGSAHFADFSPSLTLVVVSAVLSVGVAAVLLLPALRRAVLDRVRPYFRGVLPQFLDLLQNPRRLAMGFGGTFLLTVGFIACLQFSVLAFGGSASVAAVAVVFLAGNALGSAAPTPGGLGAVEAALLGGLTAVAGLSAAIALPAVLLFRLLTFWLPALPGWGAFHYLQRREAI